MIWGDCRYIFSVLLILAFVATASGHAVVVASNPADGASLPDSPPRIVLRFNAAIEKKLTRLILTGDSGAVPVTPVATESPDTVTVSVPRLSPGRYTLRYRILATDGHATPGLIRFTVLGGRRQ